MAEAEFNRMDRIVRIKNRKQDKNYKQDEREKHRSLNASSLFLYPDDLCPYC
jgi:hypothetical protein